MDLSQAPFLQTSEIQVPRGSLVELVLPNQQLLLRWHLTSGQVPGAEADPFPRLFQGREKSASTLHQARDQDTELVEGAREPVLLFKLKGRWLTAPAVSHTSERLSTAFFSHLASPLPFACKWKGLDIQHLQVQDLSQFSPLGTWN